MYRTLAFHEDAYIEREPVFSVEGLCKSKIETIKGHSTSRRTLLICSLILITTTGLLATWIFIAKPHFYPKLHIVHRATTETSLEKQLSFINGNQGDALHRRGRRSVDNKQKLEFNKHSSSKNKDIELYHRVRRRTSSHSGEGSTKKRENIKPKEFHYDIITDKEHYTYKNSRLPLDLIPEEYFIQLNIDLQKDNYTGTVKMKLQCEKKTGKIIFHGRRIKPTNITVMSGQSPLIYSRVSYIKQFEMFVVEMESSLEEDNSYDVIIEYTVGFGKSLAGLYKSSYKDNGVEK